jgi:hypothetical protein
MKTKNKNDKKQNLINAYFGVDKELPGRGDLSEKEKLIKLAKDEADIIFDVENEIIDILTREHLKEAPDMGFLDWLDTKDKNYFLKIPLGMSEGGKVVDFLSYLKQKEKPRIKKLDLDSVSPGKALTELTEAEREVVRNLLRMTFNRD